MACSVLIRDLKDSRFNLYSFNLSLKEDDCDYLLKFGKLMNSIGSNLAEGWHK